MQRRMTAHEFRVLVRQAFTNGGSIERAWRAVLLSDPCIYCGAIAENLDHILPASLRGNDDWENRAPTCVRCNSMRGNIGLLLWLNALHITGDAQAAKSLAFSWRRQFAESLGIRFDTSVKG